LEVELKITTLTPIHIGNGETLAPLSYVISGNSLYVVNMDIFFSSLSETQRESYVGWIDPILNKISELDRRIDQARENRDLRKKLQDQKREAENQLSLTWFIENRLRQNPSEFARRCLDYQIAFVLPPGRDGFRLHIKDAGKGVYIPGTEIKGAVRTSLLYTLLEDGDNYEILRRALNKLRSALKETPSSKKKIRELSKIADAQSESGIERRLLRGKEKDAKYDLLKFFNISDTNSVPHTQLKISTLIVIGSSRNIRIWLETINPRTEFHFNFNIQKRPFLNELGLEKLRDRLPLPRVFEACYHRSKEILEEEGRYFAGERNMLELISRLSKENQLSSPLLRIGFGQGFLGTTIGLKVKQRDPDLYDEAIREGVTSLRRWRTQPGKFPKTRRVTIDKSRDPESLFGWVKLSED
jgi:CRISPR-associated protein Csm5